VAGCQKDGSGRRGWKVLHKGTDTLESVKDARSVAFFDMDEDVSDQLSRPSAILPGLMQGTLDIMVQRSGEAGAGNIFFVQNNFYYDAFFLRAIGQ
jgi:integrin alpha FG-GAP repeat containing protein 1